MTQKCEEINLNEYTMFNHTLENIEGLIKDVQNQNVFIRRLAINPLSTLAEFIEFKKDKAASKEEKNYAKSFHTEIKISNMLSKSRGKYGKRKSRKKT